MSHGMQGIPSQNSEIIEAFQKVGESERLELGAEKQTAKEAMLESMKEQTPYSKAQLKYVNKKKTASRVGRGIFTEKKEGVGTKVIEDQASAFSSRTRGELKRESLIRLREQIRPGMSKSDITEKVKDFTEQEDPFLISETLLFLQETTDGALANEVRIAKEEYEQENSREVTAARNTREVVYEQGIGEYKDIRALYYDLIRNPRANTGELFVELSKVYEIKQQETVLNCLFQSAGADLRAKGPSIEPALLSTIQSTIRSLQAIRSAYNFFDGRMGLVEKKFLAEGKRVPESLTFVKLTEQFITLCKDQYPSSIKVLNLSQNLGVEKNVTGKITVFEQMRDAVKQVSRDKIFHSIQHRDEVQNAIITALEGLEDEAALLEAEDYVVEKDWSALEDKDISLDKPQNGSINKK